MTPFLIVSDGPNESTGLGRIARDLAGLAVNSQLDLDVVSVGGPALPVWTSWRHVPMGEVERGEDWGRSFVEALWASLWGRQPGVLLVVWDPGRLASYTGIQVPAQLWSYPAVDAANRRGGIGGPAGEALHRADRVIAYGRWASTVIKTVRDAAVPYLPHGLITSLYGPPSEEEDRWVVEQLGPQVKRHDRVIGCVATNQPRKDLGLYFDTLAELQARGHPVYGWLHTDVLTKAWSVV